MLKQATTLLFLSYVLLLGLSSIADAQNASPGGGIQWCPMTAEFVGHDCGSNGNYQCLLDFSGKYGASSMPKNCRCQSLGSAKHSCNCDIVCREY